jgi:outer membrane protein OmpA-like peptidoglycan-associated protein
MSALTVLVVFCGAAMATQGHPDFSGTWRPVRMETAGQSQNLATTIQDLRIKQDATTFTVFHPPDGSSSSTYKLDGSESRNADEVARVSWVGRTLVIDALLGDDKIKTKTVFSFDATGALVVELTAAPPLGSGSPTRVFHKNIAGAAGAPAVPAQAPRVPAPAAAVALPQGFTPPEHFVLDGKASKVYDFGHEPISYPKTGGGGSNNIEPEGKTWSLLMNITPPNKTGEATDAAMRAALKAQGWTIYTPSGTLVAHRMRGTIEQWFKGAAFAGDYRATIIEVGPPPHALTLPAPAPSPETIADTSDFPYLQKFPGSTLKRTVVRAAATLDATAPGAKEQRAGPPVVEKEYDLPANVSTYEFMVVYRDALTKAGWTVIRTAASSDALVVAHYAKQGRDIYGYLHGNVFQVADVGAANEAKKLAEALLRDGHVAIYGIYFDSDQSALRPDSETALQHIAELLKLDPTLTLEVQGHTDNTGTAARNQALSGDRAASVQTWLVAHGISAARLTAKGYGDTQPVSDNTTPDGRAKNRRVELKKR